jgi:hypothetical protein
LNGIILHKPDGMGGMEPAINTPFDFCGMPPTGITMLTHFSATMDPVTITVTPVSPTQLDIVLTP